MKSFNDYIVDSKRLKNNAYNIRSVLGRNTKFCAIVKANAYGIGVEAVCRSLYGIADFFAVANVFEGVSIRFFDKITPILILGVSDRDNLDIVAKSNISISISSIEKLVEVINFCESNMVKIKVHLQVNTGLNRFGFRTIALFKEGLKLIEKSEYVILEGIYSHFATKGNDVGFIKKQFIRFNQFKKYIKSNEVICHIANSFATLYDKKFHLNMVRNGFLLYGGGENSIGNKFVVTIKSKIVNIFDVKKGDTIGYDRTFGVKKTMKIAVIPLGYADGYDRRLSNKFYVLVDGEKCPIVGNICMDCFMIDITNIKAKEWSEVVILGKQKNEEIALEDMANILDTSPYEVLLKLNYKRMNYIVNTN